MEVRYGSLVKQKKKILGFERWCYWWTVRINWTGHITNENVFRKLGETRNFLMISKTRRAKLIWTHIVQ